MTLLPWMSSKRMCHWVIFEASEWASGLVSTDLPLNWHPMVPSERRGQAYRGKYADEHFLSKNYRTDYLKSNSRVLFYKQLLNITVQSNFKPKGATL